MLPLLIPPSSLIDCYMEIFIGISLYKETQSVEVLKNVVVKSIFQNYVTKVIKDL